MLLLEWAERPAGEGSRSGRGELEPELEEERLCMLTPELRGIVKCGLFLCAGEAKGCCTVLFQVCIKGLLRLLLFS